MYSIQLYQPASHKKIRNIIYDCEFNTDIPVHNFWKCTEANTDFTLLIISKCKTRVDQILGFYSFLFSSTVKPAFMRKMKTKSGSLSRIPTQTNTHAHTHTHTHTHTYTHTHTHTRTRALLFSACFWMYYAIIKHKAYWKLFLAYQYLSTLFITQVQYEISFWKLADWEII